VTPEYFEILVLRELRKVGFDVGQPRLRRRSELPDPERGFVLELTMPLRNVGATTRALIVCRHQAGGVDRDVIASAKARLPEVAADAAIIFATVEFAAEALAAAQEGGVALLQVVDSRNLFHGSDHYPAWLPAHMAQLVDRDDAGRPRLRMLEPGRPELILEAIGSGTDG
jgi:hypothetical protein